MLKRPPPGLYAAPMKAPPQPPRRREADWNWDWLAPLGLLAVVYWLSRNFIASGAFGLDNDGSVQWVQLFVAACAVAVLGWGWALARAGRPTERLVLRDRLLVVIGLSSFIGYFNFGHLHFGTFVHVWDTYHYVMGSKYFNELGYDKLYDCAAVVDVEAGRKDELLRRTLTDLRTNLIVRPEEIIAHPERCKASFSPARWEEFTRDINAFHGMVNEGRWREIHLDHGYNATPVWTLAGSALTNTAGPVTTEQLKRLNLLDPLYLTLTVLMVWWAFGPRGFAAAAITLGLNFSNRYYWTGGAFLRHDWVFYLVASICLLKKDKPYLGGAAFAYATLLRLFPGLVALGPVLAAVEYYRQHKKLDPVFAKWVVGGVVATCVLVGASFAAFGGPPTWQRFAQNTVKHSNTPLTNHMGLRTVLSYRPWTAGQRMVDNTQIDSWKKWKDARLASWRQLQPLFLLLMAFAIWLVSMAIRASGTEPWFAAALGTGFIVFGAELTNYYYCFLMGLAVLGARRREVGLMLAALAILTLVINWGPFVWMSRWLDEQYTVMSLASLFAVVGIWWLFTKWGVEAAMPEEPAPALALPGFGGPAVRGEPEARLKSKKDRRR
jgi:hypothetical protein